MVGFLIDKGTVANVYVVNTVEPLNATGLDGGLCSVTNNVRDVDTLKFGSQLALLVSEGGYGCGVRACRTVKIVALEDDGLVFDVSHDDVLDVEVRGLASASNAALEA